MRPLADEYESPGGQDSNLKIERPAFSQENLHDISDYAKPRVNIFTRVKRTFQEHSCRPTKCVRQFFPICDWLQTYNWKNDFACDVIAGVTVAIMHIPQGLGYALLANVPAVVGIYMAFFPNIPYVLLGTSRHNSMGTFAVITLLVGRSVVLYAKNPDFTYTVFKEINGTTVPVPVMYSPTDIGTSVTLLVSFWQFIFYACRFGIVCTLLSDALVNSFICGAGVHIFTSQIKEVIGVKPQRHSGPLNIIYTYISMGTKLVYATEAQRTTTYVALIISAICITFLLLNVYIFKPWLEKYTRIPFPAELVLVIAGVFAAKGLDLHGKYHVSEIGEIPKGLPYPAFPSLALTQYLLLNSFVTSIVAYAVSMSMALILSEGENYTVDPNQEFLAHAVGNLVGSIFSCIVFGASLSRSMVMRGVGGKTQLTALIAGLIIIVVLLWVADFFQPLPRAILAGIIIVALRKILWQVTDLPRFMRQSRLDGAVWLIVFFSVIIIDIDYGLAIGFILSIGAIFLQGLKAYTCLLGNIPNTDLYLDINRYKAARQIPGIKIIHYRGALNFATRTHLKEEIIRLSEVNPQKEKRRKKRQEKRNEKLMRQQAKLGVSVENGSEGVTNVAFVGDHTQPTLQTKVSCIILDFSALSSIDPAGAGQVNKSITEFREIDIPIYIAGCSGPVYEKIKKCGFLQGEHPMELFPTIHDAAYNAQTVIAVEKAAKNVHPDQLGAAAL